MEDDIFCVKAYLHSKDDSLVSISSDAYEKARPLVELNRVVDYVDYIEQGLSEWKQLYIDMKEERDVWKQRYKDRCEGYP